MGVSALISEEEYPREKVFTTAPFIAIEILSGEDRMSRVRQRIDDFLQFGTLGLSIPTFYGRSCAV